MNGHEPDYHIAVLSRALDLLDVLAETVDPLTATEIARRLGATKSATFRILINLERRGYVRKDPATSRYTLGTRLISLGNRARSDSSLLQLAHSHLERLSTQFQETANLGVLDDSEVLYVDIVESPHDLRMAARIGARDKAHSTALGKAMLAFLSEDELARYLHSRLESRTPLTITDPQHLRTELNQIRTTGVSTEFSENEQHARCIGAPIFAHAGQVCAAISVSGPASRIDDATVVEIETALVVTAHELTTELGGVWPPGLGERHVVAV